LVKRNHGHLRREQKVADSDRHDSARALSESAKTVRAAEYVRMSTDHQKYSTENQGDAIRRYASGRGFEIVRTYADEGKSGLKIDGRDALKRLIDDVIGGRADFEAILVYDVSRWGRFQDADESAYYEYICKRAGIVIHYCAEQFENDGSPISTIVKGVKRAMAGEYSRELSAKVFAGQCRLIELGFRQGGPAGFGLRRALVDQTGAMKGELERGQHKSIQTDRVILSPGPESEIDVVRGIYRAFVLDRRSERQIAEDLNERGVPTDLGRAWTRGAVHQILTNEKYVGDNVWNRVSFKLKKKRIRNSPDMWIRAEGAFSAIIERDLYAAAQTIIRARSARFSDEEMLNALRALFQTEGILSGLIIDEREEMPSSSAYRCRFGSLLRAYSLIGYRPRRDYRYIEINRVLRRLHADMVEMVVAGLEQAGATIQRECSSGLIRVNDEFRLSVVIARCWKTPSGSLRWRLRFDTGLKPDITLAIRMDLNNNRPFDFYLFPEIDVASARVHLAEENGLSLDAYRFENLDVLYKLAARSRIREAA
jgi:DNA invertase Pin-like site-specific DNA recombinase